MQNTVTLSPADTAALAPAVGSLAAITRRLAGSAFRPHSWPTDLDGASAAAAAFVLRMGFPLDANTSLSVRVGTAPRNASSHFPTLPSRFLLAAVLVADAEGVSPQAYLDRAFDLLAGVCLCKGAGRASMFGALSQHGFGFTAPPLRKVTQGRLAAAFRLDRQAAEPLAGFITRPQERLRSAALRVLALQFAQEANDAALAPLDRARRVAFAARLDPTSCAIGFGNDETGEALALYARDCAATDDGSEAWERFATAQDRANPDDGSDSHQVDRDAQNDRDAASNAADKSGGATESNAHEAPAEEQQRKGKAAQMKAAPKGRSKAAQETSEANEATDLAQGAASEMRNTPTEGGVNVAKSLLAHRCRAVEIC